MPNPPEDPGSWLTNADHAWNLFWGVCGAISLVVCGAVAYIIKCVQWADELKAEMKRTQAVTEAYRTATEGALDKYQKSTNATLQRLEDKLDTAQEQRDRWQGTVQSRIDGIHTEFKEDFRATHDRIDGVLINCVRIEKS